MISLVHRTLFVHIPKCAGQSVEAAFCDDLGLKWQKHRYLLGCFERPKGWPKAMPDRLAHLSAHEYLSRNMLPQHLFNSFYRFAIVRDPVERAISMWRFLSFEGTFETFIRTELKRRHAANDFFYRSQSQYLTDPDTGKLLVDHVIPFSRLHQHWPDVMRRAGMMAALPHRNVAAQTKQPPVLTDALRTEVQQIYREDYETFDQF